MSGARAMTRGQLRASLLTRLLSPDWRDRLPSWAVVARVDSLVCCYSIFGQTCTAKAVVHVRYPDTTLTETESAEMVRVVRQSGNSRWWCEIHNPWRECRP